ncbi:MAG: DUF927 domain-containing protein [Oscillospiraceae bacterium]
MIFDYSASSDGNFYGTIDGKGKFREVGVAVNIVKVESVLETDEVFITAEFYVGDKLQTVRCTYENLESELKKAGYPVTSAQYSPLLNYLQAQTLGMTVDNIHSGLGWFKKQGNSCLLFRGNKALSNDASFVSKYVGNFDIAPSGKLSGFKADYNRVICSNIPLEFGVVAGLTGCLVGYFATISTGLEIPTIIYDVNGRSATGKTTWAKLAVSMGGTPKKSQKKNSLAGTCSTTVNALYGSLNDNFGYTVLFDELARLKQYSDVTEMIYAISEGTDKIRMNGHGQITPPKHWATSVIFTGEHSLLSRASKADGLLMRVLTFDNVKWTADAAQANEVKNFSDRYAGLPIVRFAKYLLTLNEPEVAEMLTDEVKKLKSLIPLEECYRERVAKMVATITITARIASKALQIDLHEKEILEFVLKNIGNNTCEGEAASAYEYILNKYQTNASKFGEPPKNHYAKHEKYYLKNCDCWGYVRRDYLKTTDGGIQVNADLLVISKAVFQKWLKEGDFTNESNILRKWRDNGLIKIQKKGHFYCKLLLQSGGSSTSCIQIVLNEDGGEYVKNDIYLFSELIKKRIIDIAIEKSADKKISGIKSERIKNAVAKLLDGEFDSEKTAKIFDSCISVRVDFNKLLSLVYNNPTQCDEVLERLNQKSRIHNLLADDNNSDLDSDNTDEGGQGNG